MDVVRHQAVCPDVDATAAAPLRHQLDIERVVPWREECLLPAVASLRDVMRQIGDDCASNASHPVSIPRLNRGHDTTNYVSCPRFSDLADLARAHAVGDEV